MSYDIGCGMAMKNKSFSLFFIFLATTSGCAGLVPHNVPAEPFLDSAVTLTPRSGTYRDLVSLPLPKGKIITSVYNFKDQTGQYKPAPASSFSTSVTQGATAMLVDALNSSGWFMTLEREGLQDLLTERKIIRAALKKPNRPVNNADQLPTLLAANVLLEGAIVAYESNVQTGGAGARYLGVGLSGEYRTDQVSVNLRAVDIRTGVILQSVMTTKTILSKELQTGVFKFIEFKKLLELESGVTANEPAQLCVLSAIESAVIHLIAAGVRDNTWQLQNDSELQDSVLSQYLAEQAGIAHKRM